MQRFRKRPVQRQGSALQECRCRSGCGADRGFTLTEVLVVALIIGILLALVSAAVFPALDSAKEFAIYSEAANLSMAMESFKAQYGATPPSDLSDSTAVNNFFSRAFPRVDTSALDLASAGANTSEFDPGNALVFWLVGFSGDPSNPLKDHSDRMSAGGGDNAFYEFDVERIAQGESNGTPKTGVRYFPNVPGGAANANQDRAFLYWDRSAYQASGGTDPIEYTTDDGNAKLEAYQSSAGKFYHPRSFQIIQAGLDGTLSTAGSTGLTSDADDNIASFASGTIKDFHDKKTNN